MMSKNVLRATILVLALAVLRTAVAAEDPLVGDVYEQDGSPSGYFGAKEWEEQGIALPDYPDTGSRDMIEVSLSVHRFPFQLFIDPASVSIGEDRVVRYTAILKSRSGATNVFYEGLRCSTGQYRRYAYGSQNEFRLSGNSRWKYIGNDGSDRYMKALSTDFICPPPSVGNDAALLKRLRRPDPGNFLFGEDP